MATGRTPTVLIGLFCILLVNNASAWCSRHVTTSWGRPTVDSSFSKLTILKSTQGTTTTTTVGKEDRTQKVLEMLKLAREMGPVGVYRTAEEQERIMQAAISIQGLSDPAPARVDLNNRNGQQHDLVYSAARGGSSGKLFGPISGRVTQTFLDDTTFVNAVELGPLKLSLLATREIKNETKTKVTFKKNMISVFGQTLVEKEINGAGVWEYLFAGVINDGGQKKLIRVMKTPSLFILEQLVE